ncbi:MAG TPA: phosphatase PAP2 family protein [Candidatus Paceibacterota bacterium]|nr:phosphatase PAP2 family protein [Candidatus Paceibacterota bacterium]
MTLFTHLPQNVAAIYKGKNLAWQAAAVALTYAIVASGLDWRYFLATRPIPWSAVMPAVALGGIVPIVLPLCVVAVGSLRKDALLRAQGWALGQATLLGLLISSLYKAFTGRIPPELATGLGGADSLMDISHGFQLGFLRGGVFWGWPSSHTAVAFALGAALYAISPGRPWRWASLAWALYVGLAVSVSIHWLSEFVAGAIIGTVIGLAVGRGIMAQWQAKRTSS